jgi:hypothetical protein
MIVQTVSEMSAEDSDRWVGEGPPARPMPRDVKSRRRSGEKFSLQTIAKRPRDVRAAFLNLVSKA